jgi:hypothetical protein
MRIIANETFIERREKIANILPLVAMGVLFGSLLISFLKPEWFWATLVLALLGFFLSVIGTYFVQRFAGQLAPHQEVPKALKGFSDDYALLIYEIPGAPFVLVEPGGLTAILVKNHGGEVTYADGRWDHQQRMKLVRQFGGEEALGRPDRQAEDLAQVLEKHVNERLPDDVEVPVRSIALFINPEVELKVEDAPIPVIWVGKLKEWLRNEGRLPRLSAETRQAIAAAMEIDER